MKKIIRRLPFILGIMIICLTWVGAPLVAAQGGTVHVVKPGDTMSRIAARYGLTASQLAAANGLQWNAWVYAGQKLNVPSPAGASAAMRSGGAYVVRPGDTLVGIAARHGVTVAQLARANGLRANAWVYVGQRLTIPGGSSAPAAPAAPSAGGVYIVRPGDTLISIAARHRVTVSQLARANGLSTSAWVYVGQKLKIPGQSTAPTAPSPTATPAPATPAPSTGNTYTVRPGDTLIGIATRHGVSVSRLAAANGLRANSWVYVGQRLQIPGSSTSTTPPPSTTTPPQAPPSAATGGKWIGVNLTNQTLTAYQGQTAVFQARVSTGTWRTPTVVGTFRIYVKYRAAPMSGPGYYLPNVPYVMYFYHGYGLHGTYWHNNFGTPMSHGCVNLSTPDAQWVYNWAPVGTKVVTHY
jgi:LysM repeat protein